MSPKTSDRFELPPANSTEGVFVRLFLAECRNPFQAHYSHEEARKAMIYMKAVVFGRLREGPRLFGADVPRDWGWVGRKNPPYYLVEAIIRAPGQFDGFERYPILAAKVKGRIDQVVHWCRRRGRMLQDMRKFFHIALGVAAADLPTPGEMSRVNEPFGWRRKGTRSCGERFIELFTVQGNTFYGLLDRSG